MLPGGRDYLQEVEVSDAQKARQGIGAVRKLPRSQGPKVGVVDGEERPEVRGVGHRADER